MKDRTLKNVSIQDLTFTQEDRNKVFEEINRMENNHTYKKSIITFSKQITYFAASLLVVGLCILLFIPSNFYENVTNESNGTGKNGVVAGEDKGINKDADFIGEKDFIALLSVKDEENRIPINLLLSYNKEKNKMKVLSIPRDTYSPIVGNDGTTSYDKLTFAYVYGSGEAESVRTTVSNLFDISIDYYAVIDLETFSTMIDLVNGIEYEFHEDIRVRAITQAVFEIKKGTYQLNGEAVLALIMDATYGGRSMDEEDIVNLFSAVMNKIKNEIPKNQLSELLTKVEGDFSIEQLFEDGMELLSIHSVSLLDGMIPYAEAISDTEGKFYYKFEKKFLDSVIEELTTFN